MTAGVALILQLLATDALKSGGQAAIEEFLDTPYVNVAIDIIEAWREG